MRIVDLVELEPGGAVDLLVEVEPARLAMVGYTRHNAGQMPDRTPANSAPAGEAPKTAGTGKGPSPGLKLGTLLPLVTGVAAISAAVVYAIMRYSYQEFYNEFGLTPDDVGPSSAGALTQSSVGVGAFVVLFAFLPLALALLGSVAVSLIVESKWSKGNGESTSKRDRVRAVIALAAPVLVAVGIYRLFSQVTRGHLELPQLVVVGVAAFLIAYRIHRHKELLYLSSAWVIAVAAIAVGADALFASLPDDATKTAQCAIAFPNEPVRFVHTHRKLFWFDHMGVIRVRTDPVEVKGMDGEKPRPAWLPAGRLIYLGNAGGRDFVYARSRHQTLQIPDGSVVLLTESNPQHCHYWKHHLK